MGMPAMAMPAMNMAGYAPQTAPGYAPAAYPPAAPQPAATGAQYTCPMHPSVVSATPASCPYCHMALQRR
jgi:Cu+-exporting ATPase